jgi:uncharacterized membrane protein
MKKYFKTGLALIIPLALVYQVLLWTYQFSESVVLGLIPEWLGYEWWYTLVAILGVVVIIFFIGLLFSWITPVRWIKNAIDKYILHKIPIVSTIYKFGTEVSDSFVSDIKNNGDMQMVEVNMGYIKMLGVLVDPENEIIFIISAPSPLTGFVIKATNYIILPDMKFIDAVKINTSLGRINGSKWK